jgi:rhodanese-related sulfurtransferase
MKATYFIKLSLILVVSFVSCKGDSSGKGAQENSGEPWTNEQLIATADLAKQINSSTKEAPLIFSVGPSGLILGAIEIGEAQDESNLLQLKSAVQDLPKDKDIVIYCGCCPFEDCPNIRPAFKLLKEMGFTNMKLLDLTNNLKTDWIDKGYPMN